MPTPILSSDNNGATPVTNTSTPAPKIKLSLMTTPVTPSPDSVKMAGNMLDTVYKGKSGLNAKASSTNQRVTKLMADHVVPTIVKNKEVADNYYYEQKKSNPDYQGSTAKELDTVLGQGEGAKHIQAQKILNRYHEVFSPKTAEKLAPTPQGTLEHGVPSFGGGKATTEDLYVPDENLSKSNAMDNAPKKIPLSSPPSGSMATKKIILSQPK